jgi:SAM-dependent methyltransferase
MNWFANLLLDPSVADINADSMDRVLVHKRILAKKPMARRVFKEFHALFDKLDRQFLSGDGQRIEIGSGVAPIRDSYPDVLATDVMPDPSLDRILDAERMDIKDDSVRTVFAQNCFHHLPHPELFFHELERVLCPGGGAILLEPYYGFVASFVFRRLFRNEGFDKNQLSWETPMIGPMNGANQALSYIVFKRDRLEFERRFPRLNIVHSETCGNYLEYLFSGGLNFRQLCPEWLVPLVFMAQWALFPFNRWLALHHIIVIRKEIS